jgi:hypothetical protein
MYRRGKEIGATFSGAFSISDFIYAAADVYNGVSFFPAVEVIVANIF